MDRARNTQGFNEKNTQIFSSEEVKERENL
jgi:hypothetical protein